ncbi:S8 family serine peptidase [Reichenbachiella ulvae]|uniref:S8 family serine peptidase n=1 Tax=Reichenbachiella ulvae TaxID=2980104 RepID=A0ABT3CSF0_9BACT|nr:S8 family serine peptidase [Reichenbachiella ulvae]MCV9386579.1 S8 family serine peptidase [Reichenbachiella ulvae]
MRNFIVVILMTMGIAAHAQNQSVEFVERTVRVKFLENHGLNLASNQNLTTSQASLSLGNSQLDRINNRYSAQQIRRVFPYAGKFEDKHRKYGLHLWYDITVGENISVENLLKAYGQLDVVSMAEPVTVYNSGADGEMQTVNDPRFVEQWHYENTGQTGGLSGADISLSEAWQVETGDNRVVVSVHDSGIDIYHPDLANMLWTNEGEIPNDNLDNDNNGFVDDYYGYNFAAEVVGGDPSSVYDYHGHGTHTSGTIAAQNNNGVGVSGVAGGTGSNDGVRIMMMRLGDDYGSNSIYNPAPSFVYAADMGAVISSNSWGGGSFNQSIYDAIQYFVAEAKSPALNGGLVVMSSGNSSSSYPDYRSDIDGVIMVSATNHVDQLAWYSNYGQWVDISAPGGETNYYGQGVLSTLPGNSYGFFQGTSMACPHVTGVAGLIVSKAYGTGLTRQQLSEALISSTDPIDELNPAYAGQMGSGRVNAAAALEMVGAGAGSSGDILFEPMAFEMEIQAGELRSETITITNTSEFEVTLNILEPEVEWIQIESGALTISSGSTAKLPIKILADTEMGAHQTEIRFTHPSISGLVTNRLPVFVYTLGEPELVSTDTLQFPDVYPGQVVFQDVTISNSGTDYITLESVSITNSYFGIDFEPITIAPESQVAMPVSFIPETSGQKIDSLVFQTDQEGDLAGHTVVLTGFSKSTTPPSLVLSQDTVNLGLDNLGSGVINVTLTNEGEDDLIYSLERYPNEFYNPDSQQDGEVDYLGRYRKSLDLPVDNILDLAWDGNYLWMLQDESGFIFQFDLENELVLDTLISEATSPRSITSDGEYIYEHDNSNNQIFKYSLSDTSITVFENLTAFMGDGIAVDHRGIWGTSYGDIILIDKESGEELSRSYSSYARNSRSLIAVAGRIVCLTSSYLVSVRNSSYGYLDRYSYLAGFDVDQFMGLAFDGSGGWSYHEEAGKLVYFDIYRDFTTTDTYQRTLMGGESVELTFWYDLYDHDRGLTYQDQWNIVSNDIDEPERLITVNAHVQDEIDLSVTQFNSSINTSTGYQYLDTLVIYNNSFTAAALANPVTVDDARIVIGEHAQIVESFSELKVPYSMELSEPAEFQATFSITSYEPIPLIEVVASVKVQYPPSISIDTESISMSIYEHELDSVDVTITNSGLGPLYYDILNDPNPDTHVLGQSKVFTNLFPRVDKSDTVDLHMTGELIYQSEAYESELSIENTELPVLSELLENLNINYSSINSLIPNRYDFYDGETGYRISDGGNDMYDSGNRLNTDLGGSINYTGGSLSTSYYLRDAEYFTAKYPGLFVMAADVSQVSSFYITGGLGADGSGSVDGTELSIRIGGDEYLGFVKRVYNAGDPSVNHLIIVKNNGQVNHSFYADTNSDYHEVNNLEEIDQLYYLLFAGQSGAYIDNAQMLDIMQAFLDVAEIESLEVPANETMEVQIYFDGNQLDTGFYNYDVEIVSNDPENPSIAIPTELEVLPSPVLRTFVDTLKFGDHMVGTERFKTLEYRNEGSDTLIVFSHTSSNPELFQVYNFPDTIAPGAYGYIPITFRPDAVGDFKETILMSSNDKLHPEKEIPVSGAGLPSAIISYNPYQMYDTLALGESGSLDFEIVNKGTEPTSYRLVVEEAVTYGAIDSLIERQRTMSGVYDKEILVEQVTLPSGKTLASHILQPEEVAGGIQSVGGKNVLVLGTGYNSNVLLEVAEDLEDTEQFNYIVYVDTRYTIDMDLNGLKYFDAILFFSWDRSHGLPEEYGDLLADYADAGGGVVMALEEPLENGL